MDILKIILEEKELIMRLANLKSLEIGHIPDDWPQTVVAGVKIGIDWKVDEKEQQAKKDVEVKKLKEYLAKLNEKLGNKNFLAKAPKKIVDNIKAQKNKTLKDLEAFS